MVLPVEPPLGVAANIVKSDFMPILSLSLLLISLEIESMELFI